VLLVADQSWIEQVEPALTEAGLQVLRATTAREGLDALRRQALAVAVLSRELPDLSGLELCLRVKADPELEAVRVLLVSKQEQTIEAEIDTYEAGAEGCLWLPCDERLLCARVRALARLRTGDQARRESEARFRRTFHESPVGAAIVSLDSRFIRANQAFCKLTGYSEEELAILSYLDITHTDDRKTDSQQVERLLKGELEEYTTRKRYVRKDGRSVWARVWVRAVKDAEGAPLYLLPVVQDVTEIVRAEEALRRERDFIAAVLSTAGALVVVMDREGRIVSFNRACEELTGYQSKDVLGKALWDMFLAPDESEAVKNVFSELTAGLFPNRHQNDWVSRDGTRHRINWSNTALTGDDGQVEYVIGTGIPVAGENADS
jgi:PAS domain S-box-containing protein